MTLSETVWRGLALALFAAAAALVFIPAAGAIIWRMTQ